jgi:hypothetical protein
MTRRVAGLGRGFRLHKECEDMGLTRLAKWMDAVMQRPSMKVGRCNLTPG